MGSEHIVLPAGVITHGRLKDRAGERRLIEASSLIAYLYKAASLPEQHPVAAQTFRMLAEHLERTD